MKRLVIVVCVVMLLLTGCGTPSILGSWETEHEADALGLNMTSNFINTITRLTFTEEGNGSWEIEIVETREILRREFTYTLDGDTLLLVYPDKTAQEFHVEFEKGILLLTGRENLALKPVKD